MDHIQIMRIINQIDSRFKEIKILHGLSEAESELLIQLYSLISLHTSWSSELRLKLLRSIGSLEEIMQEVYFSNKEK